MINKSIISDHQGNELRLSSVRKFDDVVRFNHFSAKFVLAGEEQYTINQKKYIVKEGEYVLGNQYCSSSIVIDSQAPVKGICFDISTAKINEVISYHFNHEHDLQDFLFTDDFIVNKYNIYNTTLGAVFNKIGTEFNSLLETPNLVSNELFFAVAESIVKDQSKLFGQYKKLRFSKSITNKRLFAFIWNAKEFIDENFQEKICLEQIAQTANLSEYHFIRLFKSVFNQTPYQYIVHKRLQFSKLLLLDKCEIKDVSYQAGFADVQSFSKAFKARFGYTPKFFKTSN